MAVTVRERKLLLDGDWIETGEWHEVRSPYSGDVVARVARGGAEETRRALDAAERAMSEPLPAHRRAEILDAVARLLAERNDELARTICAEAGKPLKAARVEAERAVSTYTSAAVEARKLTGEVVPMDATPAGVGKLAFTLRTPIGIVGAISPFNFPLNLVAHKVAPALAARNSIIIKPSPRTPLTALLLGEVFLESGLPKSALQVLLMDIPEIDVVLTDERVMMISFTGSAAVGWKLRERAPRKFVALELGGNAPVIVDETADLKYSVERSVMAAFSYAGQVCISAQRLFVHERVADEWIASFVEKARNLRTGDPLDEETELSVMITEEAARRAEGWINEAEAAGARLLCGGGRRGALLEATVLTDVHNEMRICSEEVFAPVATIQTFSDFSTALADANNTRYGLQAGVFTRDTRRMYEAAERLEFGGVMINDAPAFRVDNMPYGGVKLSGAGREGVRYAMLEMSEPRLIVVDPTR